MTTILNVLSHIGNYAGIGMALAVAGIIITVIAIVKLSRLGRADRDLSRAEFNRKFAGDTGFSISDLDEGAMRKAAARNLGIGSGR